MVFLENFIAAAGKSSGRRPILILKTEIDFTANFSTSVL